MKMSKETQDLFSAQAQPQKGRKILTVSEVTQDIKLVLENTFEQVWVEGEVSGVRRIPTGTVFFSLKDDASILKCVIFSSYLQSIKFDFQDGIKVICSGRISVYDKRGEYQLYVQQLEPKGIGSMQLALEQLKAKLEKEGLFSAEHKRPIPYLPSRIGVVTSLSGAAIKDILKVLGHRFSDVEIIISPAQVQGEGAKEDIVRAINALNRFNEQLPPKEKIEVMIVGRGGGSIEDLWAFNEEIVARSIYASKIPVVSAVGHERDWTLADMVADLRAATPSQAAEIVIPKKEDLEEKLDFLITALGRSYLDIAQDSREDLDEALRRLMLSIEHIWELSVNELDAARKKLALLNPVLSLQQHRTKMVDLARQIAFRVGSLVKLKEARFVKAAEKLSGLSPLNILARGYSITFKMPEGQIIRDAEALKAGDTLRTKLHRGEIFSKVTETG